jgi:hypothetical protein
MKIIIIIIFSTCFSNWALAQAPYSAGLSAQRRFTGLSVGFNADMSSTTAKFESQGYKFEGLGRQNFAGSIQADYGITLGRNGVLLIGAKRYLGEQELLKISGPSNIAKITKNKHTSVFIAPGILVNEKALVYIKASYEHFYLNGSYDSSFTEARLIHGLGLGIGLRTEISKSFLLNFEVSKIYYTNDFTLLNVSTGSTYGSVGVLHTFD